jgi:hypothetical protein
MLARMMRSHIWSTSLLVGLSLMTLSCGTSTPAIGATSPTLTPSPPPTATISPTATATSVAIAGCSASSSNYPFFENPPGPLPTTIPLPPGTLVENIGLGVQAGSVEYNLCSPTTTPTAITAFMDSALPAAGWLRNSVPACNAYHGYPWYKGKYGMAIVVDVNSSMPDLWALEMCPHIGGN